MTLRLFSRRESVRDAVKRRVGLSTLPPAREAVRAAERLLREERNDRREHAS